MTDVVVRRCLALLSSCWPTPKTENLEFSPNTDYQVLSFLLRIPWSGLIDKYGVKFKGNSVRTLGGKISILGFLLSCLPAGRRRNDSKGNDQISNIFGHGIFWIRFRVLAS